MNCELAHKQIVTAAYEELAGELASELEGHLESCAECRQEREQLLAFKAFADAYPVADPSPNLVARARLRLDEALDALPPSRWYNRLGRQLWTGFTLLRPTPAAALLVLGATFGVLGGYRYALLHPVHAAAAVQSVAHTGVKAQPAAPLPDLANVAGISSVVRQSNSDIVDVRYNQLVPHQVQGSISDPSIRQLLTLASEKASSPGVRGDSVALLAAECRAGHGCQPSGIREALMVALRYDHSARVRQKALEGLEPYIGDDMRVRDAVLEAIMNDRDSSIRASAINLLEPVEADSSVRQVLYSVSNSDMNPQIRYV